MEFSVRIWCDFGRFKLFDTRDPLHDILLYAFGCGVDHLRDPGKRQSSERRYCRSDGGFQESQNVYVHRGGFGGADLGLCHCHMDFRARRGGGRRQHVDNSGSLDTPSRVS